MTPYSFKLDKQDEKNMKIIRDKLQELRGRSNNTASLRYALEVVAKKFTKKK